MQHFHFYSMFRQPVESVSAFIAELTNLAEDCDFGAVIKSWPVPQNLVKAIILLHGILPYYRKLISYLATIATLFYKKNDKLAGIWTIEGQNALSTPKLEIPII